MLIEEALTQKFHEISLGNYTLWDTGPETSLEMLRVRCCRCVIAITLINIGTSAVIDTMRKELCRHRHSSTVIDIMSTMPNEVVASKRRFFCVYLPSFPLV